MEYVKTLREITMLKPEWVPYMDSIKKLAQENNLRVEDIFVCTEETPFSPTNCKPYRHFFHAKIERFTIDGITIRQCWTCKYDIDTGVKPIGKIEGEFVC